MGPGPYPPVAHSLMGESALQKEGGRQGVQGARKRKENEEQTGKAAPPAGDDSASRVDQRSGFEEQLASSSECWGIGCVGE